MTWSAPELTEKHLFDDEIEGLTMALNFNGVFMGCQVAFRRCVKKGWAVKDMGSDTHGSLTLEGTAIATAIRDRDRRKTE